jgi:hypothetical protein
MKRSHNVDVEGNAERRAVNFRTGNGFFFGLLATPVAVFLLLQVKITDFSSHRPQFASRWTRASKKSVQSSMNVPQKKKCFKEK